MFKNQTDRKLKCLQSDNGGDYKSDEFIQFCRERGIRREFSAPYGPEQNGVAERMHRTIQERIVLCCTIPDFRRVSGPRRYSRPCISSICLRVGLLDRKFRKSFGQDEDLITESCGYSDVKHTHLCLGTSIVNSSHGYGNVFSSDMDLTEVSAIAYGTRRHTKLYEVRT
jgi:hypothetical protein